MTLERLNHIHKLDSTTRAPNPRTQEYIECKKNNRQTDRQKERYSIERLVAAPAAIASVEIVHKTDKSENANATEIFATGFLS